MPNRMIQNALFALLRLGLWPGQYSVNILPLSIDQWVELYQYAMQHTVEGIIFDSFQYLPAALLPPRMLMLKWIVRVDQIERHHQQMNSCIEGQLKMFAAGGIYPVLLKGLGVASCYAVPAHRISGDIDWYFEHKSDFRKAQELVKDCGIDVSHTAGFSAAYAWKGIVVEHHQRMFDIHNPFCFGFLNGLQKRFTDQKVRHELMGETLLLPAPILMAVQVNVHILKHMLSFGVGMRQLCDAAKVYAAFHASIDGEELKRIYQRLGILKWIHLLHTVLVKYVGLPVQFLPFELQELTDADWMMDEIWLSGNFGFFDTRFGEQTDQPGLARNQATQRLWSNVRRYYKFAPMEALCFPLVQLYSKFAGDSL